MKTQREVFNKLFKEEKTELAAEKIDLGMHDDMLKWEKRGDDLFEDVRGRINKIYTSIDAVIHNYKVAEGILEEAMGMAKELGAKDLISLYSKRENSIKGGLKSAEKMKAKLKAI